MTRAQIDELVAHGVFPEERLAEQVLETHISYVILCVNIVYKIKKPLSLSFLDFSTLAQRKHFVEQELILNQRLCPDVYLRTLPLTWHEGRYHLGGAQGEVVDHALEMRRLDNTLEMDVLLEQGRVGTSDIDRVLEVLIPFHRNAQVIKGNVTAQGILSDFTDVEQVSGFCSSTLGKEYAARLAASVSFAKDFVTAHAELIAMRNSEGFVRDVHGDLHAGNVFLTEPPTLFDCIEFNTHFRQIDLLNELAFFTMELDFAGHPHLGDHLMKEYNAAFPVMRNEQEEALFLFYKLYRANVRLKVNAIRAQQSTDAQEQEKRKQLLSAYFDLYLGYYEALKVFA